TTRYFHYYFIFILILTPPRSTLFPYTTLFRSISHGILHGDLRPHAAHAAVVSPSERDPGRRAHRALSHGVRDVLDGGEQSALPRPLSPPRAGLEFPRRDLAPHGVDHADREAAHGQPDGQARQAARRAGRGGDVGRRRQRVHRGGAQHPGVRAARHQDRVPHQRGRRDGGRTDHARAPARSRRDREHELLQERHARRA